MQIEVTLSFMEAARGSQKEVAYYANVKCKPCSGSGAKPGTRKKTCPQCRGTGQVRFEPRPRARKRVEAHTPPCVTNPRMCARDLLQETQQSGFFLVQQTCRRCSGAGSIVTEECTTCTGRGVVRERKSVKVDFPSGVDDGMTLRVVGEGNAGETGPTGHLLVKVKVARAAVHGGAAPRRWRHGV